MDGGCLDTNEYEMNDLIDIWNTNQFDKHYKILKCYVIELVSVFMIASVGGNNIFCHFSSLCDMIWAFKNLKIQAKGK